MKEFWDSRFKEPEYIYGTEPNDYFREKLAELKPGKLLLPGEGEGRNAVYAARKGWDVFAFDYSTEGRNKALTLAEQHHVSIHYTVESLTDYAFPTEQYDAAGLFFFHAPEGMRRYLHFQVQKALRMGGIVILEAFHKKHINRNTGGPGNPEYLFGLSKLAEDFPKMEILESRRITRKLSEGKFHQGEADLVQIVAQKKIR